MGAQVLVGVVSGKHSRFNFNLQLRILSFSLVSFSFSLLYRVLELLYSPNSQPF